MADSKPATDLGGFVMENHLHISGFHLIDVVICPICKLHQINKCRRCNSPLGVGSIIELLLPTPPACRDSKGLLSMRKELGGFIRRMRLRRGMTQTALASATATGISRTALSRVENGQVLPSVIALIGIAGALGVDKVTLRVRSEAKTPSSSKRS
jgi:DNA-binding XRE family transcriptional regulator